MREFRFECTKCGDCCRRPGLVELTREDLERIARFLETTAYDLVMCHDIEFDQGAWWLEVEEGESCIFLEEDRCTIEPVKPAQCRAYPFWPEIVIEDGGWGREAEHCPGIGRGPVHGPEEIAQRFRLIGEAEE